MKELLERTRVTREMLDVAGEAVSGEAVSRKAVSSVEFQVSSEGAEPAAAGKPQNIRLPESVLGTTLAQLLKRPEITIESIAPHLARLMPEFFDRTEQVSSFQFPVKSVSTLETRNAQP